MEGKKKRKKNMKMNIDKTKTIIMNDYSEAKNRPPNTSPKNRIGTSKKYKYLKIVTN